jgi:hypothetical protein
MRPTYSEILGKKALTPEDRSAFDSRIPICSGDTTGLIEVSSSGIDLFFLYGAMKCGELHPCRTQEGKVMVPASELMDAFKQDRYAYKSLAERRHDQVVILSLSIGAVVVITLLARMFA